MDEDDKRLYVAQLLLDISALLTLLRKSLIKGHHISDDDGLIGE